MLPSDACCRVLELRQYTLRPGGRDVLVELFDREFVEPQEALGMHIVGQFRDLDDPVRFVWLRGFADMESRARALGAFYGGPVWAAHRAAANATMVDSDDVLLLRPDPSESGFAHPAPRRDGPRPPARLIAATIHPMSGPDPDLGSFLHATVVPLLAATGAEPLAVFTTEPAENTFPALPVRSGEFVAVVFSRFESAAAHRAHLDRLAAAASWPAVRDALRARTAGAETTLRLEPTPRSQLR